MPAIANFEDVLQAMPLYTITNVNVNLIEKAGPAGQNFPEDLANVTSVQTDQPLDAVFTWTQSGFGAGLISQPFKFICEIYFEKMGVGEAATDFSTTVGYTAGNPHNYTATVNVPAGALTAGVYRVVACFKLGLTVAPDTPIAGFADLGMINVYVAS